MCAPYVGSKSTRVVKRDKIMTLTTNKLKEVHIDLWGPHNPSSQFESGYATIFMCEHIWKMWTLYLQVKDNFVDAFQAWLSKVKIKSRYSMKTLWADGIGEFISVRLKLFYKKRGIIIKYTALYIYEENGLAKQRWRTIVTMKDTILIDSSFPNGFWAEAMETTNYLWNRLLTRTKSHGEVIPKEAWTRQYQNLQHIQIFGSLALCNIPDKKRSKLDNQKVWQGILIEYSSNIIKHLCVWASQIR